MVTYSQGALVGTGIALPILGIVAVCLRYYVRLRLRRTYIGVDDWLILLSVLLVCGHGVIQVLGVYDGIGGQDDVPEKSRDPARLAYQQKLSKAIVTIEKFTYVFIKLSVLFLYRRVFGASRWFRRTIDVLVGLMICWGVFFIFLESFICIADGPSGTTCTAQEWALLWFGITEVLGDILILSLPYPVLRKLQMSRRDKIGLGAIFALGTLSTIMGIIRLGYVATTFYAYFNPKFFNPNGSAPGFWTTVEVSIGVVAACLPPLGPLLRMAPGPRKVYYSIRHRLLSTRSRRKGTVPGTDGFRGSERTIVARPSDEPSPVHKGEKDVEAGPPPHVSLALPANNHLSQVPALGLEPSADSFDSSPTASMGSTLGGTLTKEEV